MDTIPLIITVSTLILATFGFIFWFARAATRNNHKQMQLLSEHFRLHAEKRKSFWQLPILTGELGGFPIQIKVEPSPASEANEMEVLLTVPQQPFNFIIRRKLKIGKQKTDVELMDSQVDDYYIIRTEFPDQTQRFLQDKEIKQKLYDFKDDMFLGTSIRMQGSEMRYLMTFANVGDKKRPKIISTIELMVFLAGRLV
ncbi:hypothetical protein BKI52_16185 [marine bacterium AO1-C]|nr:hypothetical protein BKI52_16185 [marine bacterium AO1-C]